MRSCNSVLKITLMLLVMVSLSIFVSAQVRSQVTVKMAIVASDLSVKPVAKKAFIVCKMPNCTKPITGSTNFQGEAVLAIEPGEYEISTKEPLLFEDKEYSWKLHFVVRAGEALTLELSNDNAETTKIAKTQQTEDIGTIYEKIKSSVFKVFAEDASGSGFLVDKKGLIITNYHIVANTKYYLAVKINEREKYPAAIVSSDKDNDLAVLIINPQAVKNIEPLELAKDSLEKPAAAVGQRMLAVGSPLATENLLTSGIVSKVEKTAILSDVDINPGNSGGPFIDMNGKVVGVCTFTIGVQGSGVSGILRSYIAKALLDKAQSEIGKISMPEARALPVESSYRFTPAAYRTICANLPSEAENLIKNYLDEAGPFTIQFSTPAESACIQIIEERNKSQRLSKHKKEKVPASESGVQLYDWEKYGGAHRPVVCIEVYPEIGMTGGSIFLKILTEGASRSKFKYKSSFKKMELVKDGKVIEPIHPGRDSDDVDESNAYYKMSDAAYYGVYEYPPEAFAPGGELVLKIWDEKHDKPKETHRIPERIRAQIWSDFAPVIKEIEEGYGKR